MSTSDRFTLTAINVISDFSMSIGLFNIKFHPEELNRHLNNEFSIEYINLIKEIFDGVFDNPENENHYKEVIIFNDYGSKCLTFEGKLDLTEISETVIDVFMRRFTFQGLFEGKIGFSITLRKKEDNTFFNNTASLFTICQENFKHM